MARRIRHCPGDTLSAMKTPVVLQIGDDSLRPALSRQLARWPEFDLRPEDPGPGTVVVSTPRDCSVAQCLELTLRGCSVIILAPIWRALAQKEYLQAGALDYLAMEIDSSHLAGVIRDAGPAEPVAPRLTPKAACG